MTEADYFKLYKRWHYQMLHYTIPERSGGASMSVIPGGYTMFGVGNNNVTNSTHIHKCYELCFSVGGIGEYICGGRVYRIEPYTIFIADPDTLHEIRLPEDFRDGVFTKFYYLVSFGEMPESTGGSSFSTVSDENIIANFMQSHVCVLPGMEDFIVRHLERLHGLSDSDYDQIEMYHEIYSFIIGALYRLSTSAGKAENCISDAGLEIGPDRGMSRVTYEASLRLISTLVYCPVTVASVAESLHTSVRNLEYLYRRYMNMTVKDYITSVKMSAAAALLRMNAKVSETAEKLCYEDVSTFTRLFKRHMGVTPKKYQQLCSSDENVFGTVYREEPSDGHDRN